MKLIQDITLSRENSPMGSTIYADWPQISTKHQAEIQALHDRILAHFSAELEPFRECYPEFTVKGQFTVSVRVRKKP